MTDPPEPKATQKIPAFPSRTEDDPTVAAVRQMFEVFRREIHEDILGVQRLQKDHAELNFNAQEAMRKHVAKLTTMMSHVWRRVFGSDEPPPPDTVDEAFSFSLQEHPTSPKKAATSSQKLRPLPLDEAIEKHDKDVRKHDESLSAHDLSIAGLQGQMIALSSKTNELLGLQKEQMGRRAEDDSRGVLQRMLDGVAWIFTDRAGRKYLLTLIAATSGLVAAIGTFVRPAPATEIRYLPAPSVTSEAAHVDQVPRAPGSASARSGSSASPAPAP